MSKTPPPPLGAHVGSLLNTVGELALPLGIAWPSADRAPVFDRARLDALLGGIPFPSPEDVLRVRLVPGGLTTWELVVGVAYANQPQDDRRFLFKPDPERLDENGAFEALFLCTRGAEDLDGKLLGDVRILDVTEGGGHAPQLSLSGMGSDPVPVALGDEAAAEDDDEDDDDGKTVEILELEDALFRTESAVLMPGGEDPEGAGAEAPEGPPPGGVGAVTACLRHVQRHPGKKLLVAGHTDTTGSDSYNLPLSEQRAQCGLACVTGDRAGFVSLAQARHKTADYQQILTWVAETFGFDCDPKGIDGIHGQNTSKAIRGFQQDYNASGHLGNPSGAPLAVDGLLGPKTWGGFFDAYEAQVAKELETDVPGLAERRAKLAFVDPALRAVGCGEHHPIEGIGQDEFRSQTNRRVEILFFDPGEEPDLACHAGACNPDACELYRTGDYKRKHLPLTAVEDDLVVRLPHSLAEAQALSETLILESDDRSIVQEKVVASEARDDPSGNAAVGYAELDKQRSYRLLCRDGDATYEVFPLTPYAQLQGLEGDSEELVEPTGGLHGLPDEPSDQRGDDKGTVA